MLNCTTQVTGSMSEQQQAIFSSTITRYSPVRYCWMLLVLTCSSQYQDNGPTLVDTKKALSRRPIDQLGYIKDIDSLVVLSGVTNYSRRES